MKTMNDLANSQAVNEDLALYDDMIRLLNEAKEQNKPIDEGIFGALFGGLVGATAGPAVMRAVAKVLGIDEKGALYNLMTSKVILGAMGGYLGWK